MKIETRRSLSVAAVAPFSLILTLFFFSGASGLVYQVIWVRLLTRIFGSTTFAVSALLAAFMAGLGLGSFLASRYVNRLRAPLVWFGILEIGVGLYALALMRVLPSGERIFVELVAGYGLSSLGENFVKVILSFLVLLPPTTLMGASLPILVKQLVGQLRSLGVRTGSLYAVNTLGAAAGCFAAGFYGIPSWGMEATTQVAALANGIVGLCGLLASRVIPFEPSADAAAPTSGSPATSSLRWAGAAFTVSGFAAIGLEVVWTRLFTLVFKGYSYSFTAMLTVFLIGIAAGSVVMGFRADRAKDLEGLLGVIQIGIGVSVLVLTPLLLIVDDLQGYFLYYFGYDWTGQMVGRFLMSFVVLIVPTFLFGSQFPVVSRIATEQVNRAGNRVGALYTMNVLGSIVGAIITGYVTIPLLGTQTSLRLLAGSMILMGAVLVVRRGTAPYPRRRLVAMGAGLAMTIAILVTPADLSRQIHEDWINGSETLEHYEEGATATVMVAAIPGARGSKRILVNGSSASNSQEYGLSVNRIQGCIPFLFEHRPKSVFAACFGTGVTFGTLSQFDVDRIDGVDISPEVIRAAGAFRDDNYAVTSNKRVSLHIDDGRHYLLKRQDTYDVITMEPMPPSLAGVSDMYTREFYELCRKRLNPNGIMSQWVPLYYLTLGDIKMLYKTFAESFAHVMVFQHNFDTFLVGSSEPLRLSPRAYGQRVRSEKLKRDLQAIGLGDAEDMYASFLMDRETLLEFAGDAPIVTDDLPLVEFTGPKAIDMSPTGLNYLAVTSYARPVSDYLDESVSTPEMRASLAERYRAAKKTTDKARTLFAERGQVIETRRSLAGESSNPAVGEALVR